ncbi:glycosyltransferase family 9 protein [Bdellovibrio sp. HCB337]|uniref:glycosyltransferase family 9 protein n=1 Tax=Bdellovibrio sp. HCB337 TaxID=3394358 RepID=UPI0039A44693
MKILVLQLARLGDIYMTWPALRAIKRMHPNCELHFLTRSKFGAATEGLKVVDHHLQMPTKFFLEPLIQPTLDLEDAMKRLGTFVDALKAEEYDWVINYTFSPASSYLTHAITGPKTRVTGYTRHSDGFLGIPDEVSAYFYAQAGVTGYNRVHLTDLFISMLGYDYVDSDWDPPQVDGRDFGLPEKFILAHIGASEAKKSLPPFKWARVLKNFFDHNLETPVVMIGAANERNLGEAIEAGVSRGRIINLIGQTQLREVFHLLKSAQMLVGCDSAPMHMAGLTNTPCLNISFDSVNFWETGPKATHSFIYKASFPEDVVSEELGAYMHQVLQGKAPAELIQRSSGLESYQVPQEDPQELFTWNLVQALYLSGNFPVTDNLQFCQAISKIYEVNDLARQNIRQIPDKGLEVMAPLLDRADEVIAAVARVMPSVAPIVKWYQTEKARIPAGSQEEVAQWTLEVHEKLQRILSVYMLEDSIKAHESNFKE